MLVGRRLAVAALLCVSVLGFLGIGKCEETVMACVGEAVDPCMAWGGPTFWYGGGDNDCATIGPQCKLEYGNNGQKSATYTYRGGFSMQYTFICVGSNVTACSDLNEEDMCVAQLGCSWMNGTNVQDPSADETAATPMEEPLDGSAPYGVNLDCYRGIGSEGTSSNLQITCNYNVYGLYDISDKGPIIAGSSCTSSQQQLLECPVRLNSAGEIRQPTSVDLEIFGNNALYIDWLQLGRACPDDGCFEEVAHWGANGDQGWCLSTDIADADYGWAAYVIGAPFSDTPQCYSKINFDISGAYVGTASEVPYSVNIDCYRGIGYESTKSPLQLTCNYGTEALKSEVIYGSSCSSSGKMLIDCPVKEADGGGYEQPTSVELAILGSDAFFIDWLQFGRNCLGTDCYEEVTHWGGNADQGWCLSTDIKDGGGSWTGYVIGAPDSDTPQCYKSILFDVSGAYPVGTKS